MHPAVKRHAPAQGREYRQGQVRGLGICGARRKRVRTIVVPRSHKRQHLQAEVGGTWSRALVLFTDEQASCEGHGSVYTHYVIDHASILRARVTSTRIRLENFWSLLKRGSQRDVHQRGAVSLVSVVGRAGISFQLPGRHDDAGRFSLVCSQVAGQRLTWERTDRARHPSYSPQVRAVRQGRGKRGACDVELWGRV